MDSQTLNEQRNDSYDSGIESAKKKIEGEHIHNVRAFIAYETDDDQNVEWTCRGCFMHGTIKNPLDVF